MSNSIANTLISSVVVREGYNFDEVRAMVIMADRWERMLLAEKAEEEAAQLEAMESLRLEEKYQDLEDSLRPGELKLTNGGYACPWKAEYGARSHWAEKHTRNGKCALDQSKGMPKWLRSGKATRHELARRGW